MKFKDAKAYIATQFPHGIAAAPKVKERERAECVAWRALS